MNLVTVYHFLIWSSVIGALVFWIVTGLSQEARSRRRYVRKVK